jgi:hypothetical protein
MIAPENPTTKELTNIPSRGNIWFSSVYKEYNNRRMELQGGIGMLNFPKDFS